MNPNEDIDGFALDIARQAVITLHPDHATKVEEFLVRGQPRPLGMPVAANAGAEWVAFAPIAYELTKVLLEALIDTSLKPWLQAILAHRGDKTKPKASVDVGQLRAVLETFDKVASERHLEPEEAWVLENALLRRLILA